MMRMPMLLIMVCVMFGVAAPATASEESTMTLSVAQDIFAAGNAFYRAQQYEEAAMAYRELLDAGYETAPVLYNLGTTDARLGSRTLAMAHLMRASKLRPRSSDIRANLAFVKAEDQGRAGAPVAAESLWGRIYGWLTAEEWLLALWVSLCVVCTGAVLIWLTKSSRSRAVGQAALIVGGTTALLLAIPTSAQVYATKVVKKSMVIDGTEMLSGPASRFTRVTYVEPGQVVRRVGHEAGGYVRVRAADGTSGYVEATALRKI